MTEAKEVTHVMLDVKEEDPLKLDWGTPASPESSYRVPAHILRDASDEVRARLEELIGAAMTKRRANQPLTLGLELKKLAEAGQGLRNAIFRSVPGRPDEDEAYRIQNDWLPSLQNVEMHIRVWVPRGIYVPWGLVYEGDLSQLSGVPEDIGSEKFSGFWCLKYRLSTLYNTILASIVAKPTTTTEVRIVRLSHRHAWTTAFRRIPSKERTLVKQRLFGRAPAICSEKAFRDFWVKEKKSLETDLLYFFGHADGAALEFKKGDVLRLKEFPDVLRRRPAKQHPACLVFLNGCHTAIGDDDSGGFMVATAYGGYCGFIGTEGKIPDVFALRFANAFLTRLLYTGKRAMAIMDELRRDFWPLSLAYNLSCHPDFRFLSKPDEAVPALAVPDFSQEPIGSNTV
jgi:hypothetical protein